MLQPNKSQLFQATFGVANLPDFTSI